MSARTRRDEAITTSALLASRLTGRTYNPWPEWWLRGDRRPGLERAPVAASRAAQPLALLGLLAHPPVPEAPQRLVRATGVALDANGAVVVREEDHGRTEFARGFEASFAGFRDCVICPPRSLAGKS